MRIRNSAAHSRSVELVGPGRCRAAGTSLPFDALMRLPLPISCLVHTHVQLTVGTNHFGHFLLVGELLPLLKGDGRVVLTSSMLHYKGIIDKADPQLLVKEGAYNGDAAYNNSKLYNVLMAMELNKRYAGVGITANAMHPGFIPVSDFLRNLGGATRFLMTAVIYPLGRVFGFTSSVAAGAASELVAAESAESGLYFDRLRGPRAPSKLVTAENQEWLWRLSEQVTGCIYPTLQ